MSIRYPSAALDRNIQGAAYVRFVVGKDGVLEDIELLRGVHYSMDEERLHVVRSMPPWKPGSYLGEPVRTVHYLPVRHTLR